MALGPAPADERQGRAGDPVQRLWAGRGAASTALLPLAWAYHGVVELRRRLFRQGVLASHRLPVPVIVVGNLIVGGAGKTPTVIAVVELLRRHGRAPGIVSRGYGRDESAVREVRGDSEARRVGDEPLLLARRTGVPVFVGSDRVAAGHALLQAHPAVDVIVSDDGLQHLALGRDIEVLVFDDRGTGNDRLLPAGPLREPLPRSRRRTSSCSTAPASRRRPVPASSAGARSPASPRSPTGGAASRRARRAGGAARQDRGRRGRPGTAGRILRDAARARPRGGRAAPARPSRLPRPAVAGDDRRRRRQREGRGQDRPGADASARASGWRR
jgi:hypothetical protein